MGVPHSVTAGETAHKEDDMTKRKYGYWKAIGCTMVVDGDPCIVTTHADSCSLLKALCRMDMKGRTRIFDGGYKVWRVE